VASKQAHAFEDTQFRVLKLLQEQPHLKQRELAEKLGVSLGKANYCLRALVEKGQLKLGRFMRSDHRMGYIYGLTPVGVAHKAALAGQFLQRKKAEYEALRAEIDALQAEMQQQEAPVTRQPQDPYPPKT
jgi:EPS-associated MarR family transcriptional regulator